MQDVQQAVLRDPALRPTARLVWLDLVARSQGSGQAVFQVGQDELCLALGITSKTLRSALMELSSAGLVVVTRQHRQSRYEPRYRSRAA